MRKFDTFAVRLRWLRKKCRLTLEHFGKIVRSTPSYLSRLERGINTNPSPILVQQICQNFNMNESWLLKGEGEPFTLPSLNELARADAPITTMIFTSDSGPEGGEKLVMTPALFKSILGMQSYDDPLRDLLSLLKQPPYGPALTLETAKALAYVVESIEAKNKRNLPLDDVTDLGKSASEMDPLMPKLLARLEKQTTEPGSKSSLAEWLEVPLSNLSLWLSGKRQPGGEATLKLLKWVERRERGKQK